MQPNTVVATEETPEPEGPAAIGRGRLYWRRYYIPLNLLFLAVLATFLARFNWLDLIALARSASSGLLLGAFSLALTATFLRSLSWWFIARAQQLAFSPPRAFLAQLAANYWAKVTPSNVGDFMRVSYLRSPSQSSIGLFLSGHTADLLVGNVALLILGQACLLAFIRQGLFSLLHAALAFALALLFLAWLAFLFLYRPFHLRFFGWLGRLPLVRTATASLSRGTEDYHQGLSRLRPRNLILPLFSHLAGLSLGYLSGYCIARSLGLALPFHQFYLSLAVAMLVSRLIPISIFEIGSGAAALAHILVRLQVPPGLVAGYVLLAALFSGVVFPSLGAALWFSGLGRRR